MSDGDFVETVGSVSRRAGVQEATVRRYCNQGLLEFVRLGTGVRLLKASAAERVRELKEERLNRCGRHRREAAQLS